MLEAVQEEEDKKEEDEVEEEVKKRIEEEEEGIEDLIDEHGEFKIFMTQGDDVEEGESPQKTQEKAKVNPKFQSKSKDKQVELLLFSLKRERQKTEELNIKLEVMKKEYAVKVQTVCQLQDENEDLIEQMAKLKMRLDGLEESLKSKARELETADMERLEAQK